MPKRKAPSDAPLSQSTKRARTEGEVLIDQVNALAIKIFQDRYVDEAWLSFKIKSLHSGFDIQLKPASALTNTDFDECFNLISTTSRTDYIHSSWGWHPGRKKCEMKEDEMRYLLVRVSPSDPTQDLEEKGEEVQGFLSFMLTYDSTPSAPVLYIYEIHLSSPVRKLGLGSHLMSAAEDIAQRVGVEKVMLTCFLSNEHALRVYEKRGYKVDACSPEDRTVRRRIVKADYVILSKSLPLRPT